MGVARRCWKLETGAALSHGTYDGGLSLRQFYRNEYQDSFISSPRSVADAWRGKRGVCARSRWRTKRRTVEEKNVEGRRLVLVELAGRGLARKRSKEAKTRRGTGRGKEGKREESRTQKLGENERKRVGLGGMVLMKRDNLCSSCNSPVMPLYRRARPVLATLPAYIFVFVRSPAPGRRNEERTGDWTPGMPLREDASRA